MIFNALISSGSLHFDTNGVWDVRGSELQTQYDAFVLAREDYGINEAMYAQFEQRSQPFLPLHIVAYKPEGNDDTDLLGTSTLRAIREAEQKVLRATGVSEHCQVATGATDGMALPFISLDSANGIITIQAGDASLVNGSMVFFRGVSSVLVDGGRYAIRLTAQAAAFRLEIPSVSAANRVVNFTANSDIGAGARFFIEDQRCTATVSLTNAVFRAPAAQQEAVCDGFMPKATGEVSTVAPVCGCPTDALLAHDGGAAACLPCTGNFGLTAPCTSIAFVEAQGEEANRVAELQKFCAGAAPNGEEQMYKLIRNDVLPMDWACGAAGELASPKYVRSSFWLGAPLPGFEKVAGRSLSEQIDRLVKWAEDSLLAEITDIENEVNEQLEGKSRILILSAFLLQPAYFRLMGTEGLYAFGSLWFVWMWVWCSTGSMLLASCCIFECMISLPMAMAFWGMCGQQYVGFLCIMLIFVILGIGADDVFVLFDAWKQSAQVTFQCEPGEEVQQRFAWAYRRAGSSMFVTTLTTLFCFLAAGFADVPTISGFGFIAALVVLWDYVLVMTFFASATVVYYEHFERKNSCCMGRLTGHMFCCPNPMVEVDSAKPLRRQPRIFCPPLTILIFGLLVIIIGSVANAFGLLFLGAILVCIAIIIPQALINGQGDHKAGRLLEGFFTNRMHPFLIAHARKLLFACFLLVLAAVIAMGVGLRLPEESEKFLSASHPIQVYLDSGAAFRTGGNPMMTTIYVVFGLKKDFALDRTGVDFQQPGTSFAHPVPKDPLGKVQYSTDARDRLFTREGQQEVQDLCDAIRADSSISANDPGCELVSWRGLSYPRLIPDAAALVASGVLVDRGTYYEAANSGISLTDLGAGTCETGVYCFAYDVRDYLVYFCDPASGLKAQVVAANPGNPLFNTLCLSSSGSPLQVGPGSWPAADLGVVVTSPGYRLFMEVVAPRMRQDNGYGFDDYARLSQSAVGLETVAANQSAIFKLAFLGVNASLARGIQPYGEQVEQYDKFKAFFDRHLVHNSDGFFVCFIFNWMTTMGALLRNTIQSVCIALVFCWFVLVFTSWNLAVGTVALVGVTSIVILAGGSIVMMGWTLGIIESIACIVIVGISVDYSVHLAHAYNEAEPKGPDGQELTAQEQRNQKTQMALGTIGISLFSGFLTSLGASFFLWFCNINFFRKFGMFLFMTLIASFLMAFLLLIPLLIVIGPSGSRGQLPDVPCCRKKAPMKVLPED